MTRPNPWRLAGFLVLIVAVFGGAGLIKGGFYIGKHEGDTLHLAEIVLRMAAGQWPHLDFMTPIGALAMAPMALFVQLGAGLGHAIFLSQIMVALILMPAVIRVARSRFGNPWGWAFGGFVMILCVALVHGEAQRAVSISMHYNRWSWAIAYVVLPLVMIAPEGRARPWLDGAILGLGMAALVLIKATYFAALMPAVVVTLLARRWWGMAGAALVAGLAVAGGVTLWAGAGFWAAYLGDLVAVATSPTRPQPGEPWTAVVAAPAFMGASLTLVAAVILLRQAGRMTEGLMLLLLMPGFFYIVFQNFGNDPQWLVLVALFALRLRPAPGLRGGFGWDLRAALSQVAVLALAFGAPSALNLGYSPFRHLATPAEKMIPLLSGQPAHADVLALEARIYGMTLTVAGDGPDTPYAGYRALADRGEPVLLNGEDLPVCEQQTGVVAWFETVTRELMANGHAGQRLMAADLYSSFWLWGDFRPVEGAAPWSYGGTVGLGNADYLVVPLCPVAASVRTSMLKALKEGGWRLTEVERTPLYILIEASAP